MALYSSLVNLMEVEGEQERATSAVLTSPLSAESLSSSRSQPQCQPQLHGYRCVHNLFDVGLSFLPLENWMQGRFVLMQVNEEIGTEQDSKMISSVSWQVIVAAFVMNIYIVGLNHLYDIDIDKGNIQFELASDRILLLYDDIRRSFQCNSSSNALKVVLPPGEETPLLGEGDPSSRSLSSQANTFANVFIAIIGARVLGLPYTFKCTGWVRGLLMLFAVASRTYHCMMLLIHTFQKLDSVHLLKNSNIALLLLIRKEMITANMGARLVTTLVKFGLCVNLFFTLPIMMNLDYEIVERRFWGGRCCLWLRWLSVLLVSLVAILVPNFVDFLCLVGNGVCFALGFILPSLFHLVVFIDKMAWGTWCSHVSIMVVGLVLGVLGT
ncbi:hypothetical protein FEM48_Zijuj06G0136300 [Ziziphus jujuba var. spinosa]|uniref:Amino acid transporter transmembrane domain-containing protein n=1 Tax=Ziziphus jujuba var. spinosa TaxID=714518 RepID=A0A978V9L2_ZIZJJ|nr:hypothetical protein FEM48_Zijuj06G0136300 [Ziziphus jujuba var. spinosa]